MASITLPKIAANNNKLISFNSKNQSKSKAKDKRFKSYSKNFNNNTNCNRLLSAQRLQTKMNQIVKVFSESLEDIILFNSKELHSKYKDNTIFHCDVLPEIGIEDYLIRLIVNSGVDASTIIIMSMYIDRLCEHSCFFISPFNVHR